MRGMQVEDKIKAFEFNDEYIIPGVKAMPSLWHNVGSATFVIDDNDSKLVVAALNHHILSVENPQFIFSVDYDQASSVAGAKHSWSPTLLYRESSGT